jgi:hypothetical protein
MMMMMMMMMMKDFYAMGAADDDNNCTRLKLPEYFWEVTIGNLIGDYQL